MLVAVEVESLEAQQEQEVQVVVEQALVQQLEPLELQTLAVEQEAVVEVLLMEDKAEAVSLFLRIHQLIHHYAQ